MANKTLAVSSNSTGAAPGCGVADAVMAVMTTGIIPASRNGV